MKHTKFTKKHLEELLGKSFVTRALRYLIFVSFVIFVVQRFWQVYFDKRH